MTWACSFIMRQSVSSSPLHFLLDSCLYFYEAIYFIMTALRYLIWWSHFHGICVYCNCLYVDHFPVKCIRISFLEILFANAHSLTCASHSYCLPYFFQLVNDYVHGHIILHLLYIEKTQTIQIRHSNTADD